MKLNERADIVGVRKLEKGLGVGVSIDDERIDWHPIFKDKKGSYIKIKDYFLEGFAEEGKVKKYYIKGDLWWAVNRFEKYLEEGDK